MIHSTLSGTRIIENRGCLLYQAIIEGDVKGVNEILNSGLRPKWSDIRSEHGHSCNLLVAASDYPDIVSALLLKYSNKVIGIKYIVNAIMRAARNGHHEALKILFERMGDKISQKDKVQALSIAATLGHFEMVSVLVGGCGNVFSTDNVGSALKNAACGGHHETVALLLKQCGNVITAYNKRLALEKAASNGHHETVAVLLEYCQTDISFFYKKIALYNAIENNHHETVSIFLKQCSDEFNLEDKCLALVNAARNGHQETIRCMIQHFSAIVGKHALLYTAMNEHPDVFILLLEEYSKQIDDMNYVLDGLSPLHYAIKLGNKKIFKKLINSGADILSKFDGMTPLEYALSTGRTDIAGYLSKLDRPCTEVEWAHMLAIEDRMLSSKIHEDQSVSKLVTSADRDSRFSKGLLSDEQFASIEPHFLHLTESLKLKRGELLPYSVIRSEEQDLYAIYSPQTSNKEGHRLGKGAFGKVKMAQNLSNQEWCAIKVSKHLKSLKREASFLKMTNQYYGFATINSKHYLMMKFIPGLTLHEFSQTLINKKIKLSKRQEARLLLNLLKSYHHLIELNIKHNDLHACNIMVDPESLQFTIIDYGLAISKPSTWSIAEINYLMEYLPVSSERLLILKKLCLENPTEYISKLEDYTNSLNAPPRAKYYSTQVGSSTSSSFLNLHLQMMGSVPSMNKDYHDSNDAAELLYHTPIYTISGSSTISSSSFADSSAPCAESKLLSQRKRQEKLAPDSLQDENYVKQNTKRQRLLQLMPIA